MDFPTRDLYRKAIEQLARGSSLTELEVTEKALDAARQSSSDQTDAIEAARSADPGYHLISEGRPALERAIGFHPPVCLRLGRLNVRLGIAGYVGSSLIVTAVLMALSLMLLSRTGLETGWLVMFAALAFLPATEVATAIVNRAMSWCFGATILPGLSLRQGMPPTLRTLVAIPTLLTSETDILEQVERQGRERLARLAAAGRHRSLCSARRKPRSATPPSLARPCGNAARGHRNPCLGWRTVCPCNLR